MTPLEELQAAHKRLSELRGPVEQWHHINRNGPRIVDDLTQYGGFIAELDQERDADLIVILHRTIDAQLKTLEYGIEVERRRWAGDPADLYIQRIYLPLACAINGGNDV